MSSLKPFLNENASPISRRFFAFVIDLLIILVLHILAFVVSTNIVAGTSYYKETQQKLVAEMKECYKITEESRIYEFIGEGDEKYTKTTSNEEMFLRWSYSHILKSFNTDNSVFIKYGITKLDIDEKIKEASYETDNIAYFFTGFVKDKNEEYKIVDLKEEPVEQYYYSFFKKHAFSYNGESLWIYDDVDNTIPILKGNFAYNLYYYLKIDQTYQEGLSCYNLLAKSYQNMWNEEVQLLVNCDGYKIHYSAYDGYYCTLSQIINVDCAICYACVFLLAYVLPIIIFKRHQSIGKKAEKVLAVDIEGYKAVPWQIVVRVICKFFGFFGFTVVSNFLSSGANSAWVYPLFYIGGFGVSFLTIDVVFLVLAFISFIISAFTPKKRNISDFLCHTYVIDIRGYMDHNEEAIEVNNTDKKEEPIEVQVIDSSTIRKS